MTTVLVVDDDESYRSLVVLTLEDECGLSGVKDFPGGGALLRHVDAHRGESPGLVLLDLHMPDMDGLAVLRELRRREPQVPVAFLSGAAAAEERDACLAAGAVAFLRKPIAYAELTGMLQELVQSCGSPDPRA